MMQSDGRKGLKKNELQEKIYDIETVDELWDFWNNHPNLILPKIAEWQLNPNRIISVLSEEIKKDDGADVDVVIRSFTASGKVKDAIRSLNMNINLFGGRRYQVRLLENFLKPFVDVYSLEKAVSKVISRDYGKTCVRISSEDIKAAAQDLKEQGRVVTVKTVENYLYETLPHEKYLSDVERRRLGLL